MPSGDAVVSLSCIRTYQLSMTIAYTGTASLNNLSICPTNSAAGTCWGSGNNGTQTWNFSIPIDVNPWGYYLSSQPVGATCTISNASGPGSAVPDVFRTGPTISCN